MMHLTLHSPFGDVAMKSLRRPAEMSFGVVLPDYETAWNEKLPDGSPITITSVDRNTLNEIRNGKTIGSNWGRPAGDALPATARFTDDTPVLATCELQWSMYRANAYKAKDEATAKANFKSLFSDDRFATNRSGTGTYGDCINTPNADPKPEFQIQPLLCGGALFRIVDEGVDFWLVEAINPLVSFESFYLECEWLSYVPTTSARNKIVDDKNNLIRWEMFYQEPFFQFGENFRMPVFGFIKNNKATVTGYCNILPKFRGRRLGDFEPVPHPYIMRDGRKPPHPYKDF